MIKKMICLLLLLTVAAAALTPAADAAGAYTKIEARIGVSGEGTYFLRAYDISTGRELASKQNAELRIASGHPNGQGYGEFVLHFSEPDTSYFAIYDSADPEGLRYIVKAVVTNSGENSRKLSASINILRNDTDEKHEIACFWATVTDPPITKKITSVADYHPNNSKFLFDFIGYDTSVESLKGNMPMPEGSVGQKKELVIYGSGEVEAGVIRLLNEGSYIYRVVEKDTGESGYVFDKRLYEITYVVKETRTGLEVTESITCDGKPVDKIEFTNHYTGAKVGPKTGDDAQPALWASAMVASMVAIAVIAALWKRREDDKYARLCRDVERE